jgi:hypothetical protein
MDSLFLTVAIAAVAGSAARHYRCRRRAAEQRRRLQSAARILIATLAFIYAGMAAAAAIVIPCRLAFGSKPGDAVLYLTAAVAIFFAWIGLRPDRCRDLLVRVKRAGDAAVEAFFAPVPDGGKPKPEIDRDLD